MRKLLLCLTAIAFTFWFPLVTEAADPYVVESGDCLWTIAQRHGVTVAKLVMWNGIENPDLIHPGDVLTLELQYMDAADYALNQLDAPYTWGGNGHPGYDCSGLVQQAYLSQGIRLPRTADSQYWATERTDNPDRGDLAFFCSDSGIVHVGLMISLTRMVHATSRYGKIVIESPWAYSNICYFGRV